MKNPKSISPDNLKDTIIQVLFEPGIAPELILGSFNHNLKDKFDFVAGSPQIQERKIRGDEEIFVNAIERGFFLDKDQQVKVSVGGNAIIFNSYKGYIGWDRYFPIIKSTLETLLEEKIINHVIRIGVRYISQYPALPLFEKLNVSLSLPLSNKELNSTQIRTEIEEDNMKIILSLLNNIAAKNVNTDEDIAVSVIDIDVIQLFNQIGSLDEILNAISKGHEKQKNTFFSLLTKDFLSTLNPIY
jgi:uncharacterized protein (TIGR04255 family)